MTYSSSKKMRAGVLGGGGAAVSLAGCLALGVLLLLLAAIPGDNAWNTVHNVLRGLMGWCCYLMGPLMMIVAVLLTMDRTAITPGLKSASVVLMVLLLVCMAVMRKLVGRNVEGGL